MTDRILKVKTKVIVITESSGSCGSSIIGSALKLEYKRRGLTVIYFDEVTRDSFIIDSKKFNQRADVLIFTFTDFDDTRGLDCDQFICTSCH